MLQLITHRNDQIDDLALSELALKGGCRWIQLRMKDASVEEIKSVGAELLKLCKQYNATAILDDHVELAIEMGFDGVHLGKHDMCPTEARKIAPKHFIIGGTANTLEDMELLIKQGVDYIGLGPFQYTETKANLSPMLGLEGYQTIVGNFRRAGYTIPIVAIGGITESDIPSLIKTGITGVALSGAILNAEDPTAKTSEVIRLLHGMI